MQLGRTAGASIDELAARSGLRKAKLAKMLWHLQGGGWITAGPELKRVVIYRRLRDVPREAAPRTARPKVAPHIEALNAAFGIRLPATRARGRTIRRSE